MNNILQFFWQQYLHWTGEPFNWTNRFVPCRQSWGYFSSLGSFVRKHVKENHAEVVLRKMHQYHYNEVNYTFCWLWLCFTEIAWVDPIWKISNKWCIKLPLSHPFGPHTRQAYICQRYICLGQEIIDLSFLVHLMPSGLLCSPVQETHYWWLGVTPAELFWQTMEKTSSFMTLSFCRNTERPPTHLAFICTHFR